MVNLMDFRVNCMKKSEENLVRVSWDRCIGKTAWVRNGGVCERYLGGLDLDRCCPISWASSQVTPMLKFAFFFNAEKY